MREFRVLLVVPLGNIGGTELSTLSLARGLRKAGHQVYVMCNPHPLAEAFAEAGVVTVQAGMRRNIRSLLTDAATMRRCLADNQIEIIHFQSAFPIIMALLSRRAIKAGGVKVLWTCRGIEKGSYAIVGRLFNHVVDFVIANCNAEREKLLRHGLSSRRTVTIYNTPNLSIPEYVAGKNSDLLAELGIDVDTPIVGTASRLSLQRGVQYFVEATASVSQAFPEVRFVIAGGGPAENELRKQTVDLDMRDRVVFLGPRRDMERVYSIMDVFVNPCPNELGTGNTNAEAMAFGKPVVAINRGGTPELVHDGTTGLVVAPRDSQALAQATLRLLRDRGLAKRMGAAGRERILKDLTLERLVREVEEVYSRLLKQE